MGDALLRPHLPQQPPDPQTPAHRYATVMFSAGPMFVTMQWAFYEHPEQLTILPVELYGKYKVGGRAVGQRQRYGCGWALNLPGC